MSISRSENMARIKCKSTSTELILRKELRKRRYRFKTNEIKVFGKPDIVFRSRKLAVFCDSEFWHGKKYLKDGEIPKTHKKFWINKLKGNIARDKKVNRVLKTQGWTVVRIWEKDIKRSSNKCVLRIEKYLAAIDEANRKKTRPKTPNRLKSRFLRTS